MIPCLNPVITGGGQALEEYIATAAECGYGGVDCDIGAVAEYARRTSPRAASDLFVRSDVLPACFGLPADFRGDDATFSAGLAHLPGQAALAHALDCTRCVTWIPPTVDGSAEEFWAAMVKRLRECAKVLGDCGVRLGLEWVAPKTSRATGSPLLYTMDGALRLAADIGEPNVGLLVDTWHWHCMGGTREDIERLSVEQIVHVHINDAADQPVDTLQDMVRLLPGEGVIDLVTFLQVLRAKGYPGFLSIETFSAELPKLGPLGAARRAKDALDSVLARV